MLPTSVGSGSPAEARGGTTGVADCWGGSAAVAGALRKLRGELIALTLPLLPICRNGSTVPFFSLLQVWLSQGLGGLSGAS